MEENKQLTVSLPEQLGKPREAWEKVEWHCLNAILTRVRERYVDSGVELSTYEDTVMIFSDDSLLPEGMASKDLMLAFARLKSRQDITNISSGGELLYSIVNTVKHDAGEWRIKVEGYAMPLLVDTAKHQTADSIIAARKFSTKYAALLYTEAFRHSDGKFNLTFDELRSRGMANAYASSVWNFDTKAIQPAVREIKETFNQGAAEIWLTYERLGKGKKVVFAFTIHRERERQVLTPAQPAAQQPQANQDVQQPPKPVEVAQAQQPSIALIPAQPDAQAQQQKPATPDAQADVLKQLQELKAKDKEREEQLEALKKKLQLQHDEEETRKKELERTKAELVKERARFSVAQHQGFMGKCRLLIKVCRAIIFSN